MLKEPQLLDLLLIHLQERGVSANGWKSQAETCDDLAWITVNRGEQPSLYVSTHEKLVLISDVAGKFKCFLDPFNPEMFDQLDRFIEIPNGGDP